VFHDVKAQELQDEIAKIQVQKVKCSARNQNLLQNIDKALEANDSGANKIAQMREELENQKRQFLKELNVKDPEWQDKVKQRKKLEMARIEQTHEHVKKEIE